jgi:hypothetical protein
VLLASAKCNRAVKFYCDEPSGLLVRVVRCSESPLAATPHKSIMQIIAMSTVCKSRFAWPPREPEASSNLQIEAIQQNVPIDGAMLAKP